MLPADLTSAHFTPYPPQAKAAALARLPVLQQLPLTFLPGLLRELIDYDYKFPAEKAELDRQLTYLASLSQQQLRQCLAAFAEIHLSPDLMALDWSGQPAVFSEQLSAYLWRTHQMDTYRSAATAFGVRIHAASPPQPPSAPRLGIAVIGQGAASQPDSRLFANLRKHGTYFNNVDPAHGLQDLFGRLDLRSRQHAQPHAHWYVDGASAAYTSNTVTTVSFGALSPMRDALLERIQHLASTPGSGPETLRDALIRLQPSEIGMHSDSLLDRFQLKLLTEGSGTQIFSTTFAQWTAREVLRRAEPLTLLVRFAPRQRQRPMHELLAKGDSTPQLDPQGSLVDADMGAYYHWINQQRLSGAAQSGFLVWFEQQNEALAIGPSLPRGTTSHSAVTLASLLNLIES